MLGFLLTDGRSPADLGMGLQALADDSFHRVTVDGDTSPNDTLLLWTAARHWCRPTRDRHGVDVYPLEQELTAVSRRLSRIIARDGEGATKLVTVQVKGALSDLDTLEVGRFIATSPLVKTAIYGRDPNWGRILSSAGTSGVAMNIDKARVWIGDFDMFSGGVPHPENEAGASDFMVASDEIVIGVDLGMGPFEGEAWTCDMSPAYVTINADYRS
jgi:glutamate N-acetyltransferase/amino-acid N-acetyltransferase